MNKNKGNKGVEEKEKQEGWPKAPAGGPRERSDEETIGRPVQLDEQGRERGPSGEKRSG